MAGLMRPTSFILALLTVIIGIVGVAQGVDPSPTPPPTEVTVQSVFADDTCAPPCWFGLTPGISTSADVETMLTNFAEVFAWRSHFGDNGNVFDAMTGQVIDGGYVLWWHDFERDDDRQLSSSIAVEAGVVRFIYAEAPQVMLLDETIELLGTPDDIHLSFYQHGHTLTLIYVDIRLRVYFYAPHSPCRTTNMLRDFTLTDVHYLSPDAALKIVEGADAGEVHSLTAVGYGSKQVPAEVWDQWIAGEVDLDCGTAWGDLPEEINPLPLDAEMWETITPTASATDAVTPTASLEAHP